MPDEAYRLARSRIINAKKRNQTSLDLSNKGLSELPPEIGLLKALKTLDLTNNNLASLPAEIGQLSELSDLNLSHNSIRVLPPEIWNLKKLNSLQFSNNQIGTLPSGIGGLTLLIRLRWNGNNVASLPAELGNLKALRTLSLSKNKLFGLPVELAELTKLVFLDLEDNNINEFPSAILGMVNLNHLYMERNKLRSLPSKIGSLSKLETLVLPENNITYLPEEIATLTHLRELDLRNNKLKSLPSALGQLLSLEQGAAPPRTEGLSLAGNPLPDPYPILVAQEQPSATTSVLAFLRNELDLATLASQKGAEDSDQNHLSEKEIEGALEQRPASFRFGFRNGKIDALPEQPAITDIDVAADLHTEVLSKARALESRLIQTNSDQRVRASATRLLSELEKGLAQIRPGILLSRSRSIEADRNAFDTQEARRELFPDAIAMMDDVLLSLQDLMAIFPIVREIEAERLALSKCLSCSFRDKFGSASCSFDRIGISCCHR
jgi:hypothetical protein